MEPSATRGRWAFGLTLSALSWGVALVVAAFVLPVYDASTSGASGVSVDSGSSTLVAVNGLGVLAPVALPALVAAVVWFALHRKCSRGSRPQHSSLVPPRLRRRELPRSPERGAR